MEFSTYEPEQNAYISYDFISQKWYKNGLCYPTNEFHNLYLKYASSNEFADLRKKYNEYRLRCANSRSKTSGSTKSRSKKSRSSVSKDIFG